MKKILLMSLFATFMSLTNATAQDNTYSMVIKLANGTVLTIGPNEVDSISFNNGEIAVSGKDLNTWLTEMKGEVENCKAQINKTDIRVDSVGVVLWNYVEELRYRVDYLMDKYLEYLIDNEKTRTIDDDGFWYSKGEKTYNRSVGRDGQYGRDGRDGDDRTIVPDSYWYKNGVKTDYRAVAGEWTIGDDGYWYKNGVKTEWKVGTK